MGFHLALGIFLRGVAEGEGVVAEDHRAARSEGLHVQAGIGTAGKGSLPVGEAGRGSAAPSSPEGEATLLARQEDSTRNNTTALIKSKSITGVSLVLPKDAITQGF